MVIEETAFPVPWHESAYYYEIAENRVANYQALEVLLDDRPASLIGYAGFWMMVDEAHISTIAVATEWRGRGLGKVLLLNLLLEAYRSEAIMVTLEVRKSNITAQALYQAFEFEVVGGRKRYYQGKEDALIMTRYPLDRSYRAFLRGMESDLLKRINEDRMLKTKTNL